MKKIYEDIIKNVISTNQFTNPANPFNNKLVQDAEYDMIYDFNSNLWSLNYIGNITNYNNQHENFIVILESPHIDEFDQSGNGIRPLKNDKYFIEKFGELLNKSINFNNKLTQTTKYTVYLVNAIQYQCSLGYPTEYYRDYVFLYYWERKKQDFMDRLKKIINSKTIGIINLCTKGSHKMVHQIYDKKSNTYHNMYKVCGVRFINKVYGLSQSNINSLNSLVDESIKTVITNSFYQIIYTIGNHPSSWHSNRARIE